ncbi:putative serine/threonine-protein kinase nek3 [Diplonema papillatum]|nr:putative serine/threonine-protein kinase nek3 [Diplonema papillatum]
MLRGCRVGGYVLGEQVGQGTFGYVYMCRAEEGGDAAGSTVMKLVNVGGMASEKEKDACLTEIRVLSALKRHSCPYIVDYRESFWEGANLCVVMDYAGTDLRRRIVAVKEAGGALGTAEVWTVFIEVLLGLELIHRLRVLHRDLKSENIFLGKHAKIGDFGLAKVLEQPCNLTASLVGTPYYLSPEVCSGEPYGELSDVWSLGVVLFEMATACFPFTARNHGALVLEIMSCKLKGLADVSSRHGAGLAHTVAVCLQRTPSDRMTAAELLSTPPVVHHANRLGIPLPGAAVSLYEENTCAAIRGNPLSSVATTAAACSESSRSLPLPVEPPSAAGPRFPGANAAGSPHYPPVAVLPSHCDAQPDGPASRDGRFPQPSNTSGGPSGAMSPERCDTQPQADDDNSAHLPIPRPSNTSGGPSGAMSPERCDTQPLANGGSSARQPPPQLSNTNGPSGAVSPEHCDSPASRVANGDSSAHQPPPQASNTNGPSGAVSPEHCDSPASRVANGDSSAHQLPPQASNTNGPSGAVSPERCGTQVSSGRPAHVSPQPSNTNCDTQASSRRPAHVSPQPSNTNGPSGAVSPEHCDTQASGGRPAHVSPQPARNGGAGAGSQDPATLALVGNRAPRQQHGDFAPQAPSGQAAAFPHPNHSGAVPTPERRGTQPRPASASRPHCSTPAVPAEQRHRDATQNGPSSTAEFSLPEMSPPPEAAGGKTTGGVPEHGWHGRVPSLMKRQVCDAIRGHPLDSVSTQASRVAMPPGVLPRRVPGAVKHIVSARMRRDMPRSVRAQWEAEAAAAAFKPVPAPRHHHQQHAPPLRGRRAGSPASREDGGGDAHSTKSYYRSRKARQRDIRLVQRLPLAPDSESEDTADGDAAAAAEKGGNARKEGEHPSPGPSEPSPHRRSPPANSPQPRCHRPASWWSEDPPSGPPRPAAQQHDRGIHHQGCDGCGVDHPAEDAPFAQRSPNGRSSRTSSEADAHHQQQQQLGLSRGLSFVERKRRDVLLAECHGRRGDGESPRSACDSIEDAVGSAGGCGGPSAGGTLPSACDTSPTLRRQLREEALDGSTASLGLTATSAGPTVHWAVTDTATGVSESAGMATAHALLLPHPPHLRMERVAALRAELCFVDGSLSEGSRDACLSLIHGEQPVIRSPAVQGDMRAMQLAYQRMLIVAELEELESML